MADTDNSSPILRYNLVSGQVEYFNGSDYYPVAEAGGGILQLTGAVTAGPGSGSQVASLTSTSVTAALLTGYVSGAGTVAATDTILQGINKLNGNDALRLLISSFTDTAVTSKLLTGYVSGAGTVAATDTILQGINKLNGNQALYLPLTGGALTGAVSITTAVTSPTGLLIQDTAATGSALLSLKNDANELFNIVKPGSSVSALGVNARAYLYSADNGLGIIADGSSNTGIFLVTQSANIAQLRASFDATSSIPGTLNLGGVVSFTAKNPVYKLTATAGTGTVTPDATTGPTLSIPVSGAVTLNGPTGGYDGQKLTIRVVNDGSHSVTLATGSGNFAFGTTITSYTNSVSLIDYIGVIWNTAASRWHVVSLSQGF